MHIRGWLAGVLAVALGAGSPSAFAWASPSPEGETLYATGFEEGIADWEPSGAAAFSASDEEPHEGAKCARIVVEADTPPAYQHLEYALAPVAPGDVFWVTMWVRTEGVRDGKGAYAALVFQNGQGQRVGIAHSATNEANGRKGWEQLVIDLFAPEGTEKASLHLLLHAHGTAWFDDVRVVRTARRAPLPDLGPAERVVKVHKEEAILDHFGGVGFHVHHHVVKDSPEYINTVLAKRWRELNPSFARLNIEGKWRQPMLDRAAEHLLRLKNETQTEVYLATWNPKETAPGPERAAYAEAVAEQLAYWVEDKGADNITTYCMSNELTLGPWGSLINDLGTFKDYHEALYKAFEARGLDVRLLATDAAPIARWHTIGWATEHMDSITGVYGGHHYINAHDLDDLYFYPWFSSRLNWGVGMARTKGKDFILGEFGCRQDGRTVDGVKRDTCVYWNTPSEPMVAIQLAEAVIAAINAGAYGMGYWTFVDMPDDYFTNYINKWGVFKRSGDDHTTRAHYYGFGLLTKFFRGPATSLRVDVNDPYIRAAAVAHHGAGTLSIAVVNRYPDEVPLAVELGPDAPAKAFRKYVYDPKDVPQHPFGDLQGPTARLGAKGGRLTDRIGPDTLTVYTTAYDDEAPPAVEGLAVKGVEGEVDLTWLPCTAPDFCYYRVYRSAQEPVVRSTANQIGSTIATHFTDAAPVAGQHYAVVAVDQSGNAR